MYAHILFDVLIFSVFPRFSHALYVHLGSRHPYGICILAPPSFLMQSLRIQFSVAPQHNRYVKKGLLDPHALVGFYHHLPHPSSSYYSPLTAMCPRPKTILYIALVLPAAPLPFVHFVSQSLIKIRSRYTRNVLDRGAILLPESM